MNREDKLRVSFILVAAGRGDRFGGDKLKERVFGRPLLHILLDSIKRMEEIDELILVTREEKISWVKGLLSRWEKPVKIVEGGETREDSVYNGLLASKGELVLVHDGARPLLSRELVRRVVDALSRYPVVVPVLAISDTLREEEEGVLGRVIEREGVLRVQTPQGFKKDVLLEAHRKAGKKRRDFTDDSTLTERMLGIRSHWVKGHIKNIKITTREDLELLNSLLIKEIRVGLGFDRHRLVSNRPLVIGGVKVPFDKGALGHSDGDVVIHALVDSLLGASGLGNIGLLFPDTDPRFKDRESSFFLTETVKKIEEEGYILLNADITVLLEKPKIIDFIENMRSNLASFLHVPTSSVNVKPKRGEGLDSVGRGEAIEAFSLVTLIRGG